MLVWSSALTQSIPKTGHRLDLLCPFLKYCLWFCCSPGQSNYHSNCSQVAGGMVGKGPSKKQGASLLPRDHIIKPGAEMKIQILPFSSFTCQWNPFCSAQWYTTLQSIREIQGSQPFYYWEFKERYWMNFLKSETGKEVKKCSRGQVLSLPRFSKI